MRVQIPAYTDHWMRGDRFGEVVSTGHRLHRNVRAALLTSDPRRYEKTLEYARVKLDGSGRTVRVILADCLPVDDADPYGIHEERRRHP